MYKQLIVDYVDSKSDFLIEVKRFLYEHPELGLKEFKGSEKLISILKNSGFEVKQGISGYETAFVATVENDSNSTNLAVLLEYDALPEVGHACGHNFIAAAGLGAALAIKKVFQYFKGSLKVFGTPAEETVGTKVKMVNDGFFDNIHAAMMVHPSNGTDIYTKSLACRAFNIVFHGKESHAAANPEKGINALDAFVQFYISLDLLKKQLRKDVRIPGIVLSGGTAPNIVPARVEGKFTVRSLDWDYLQYVYERVEKLAQAAAEGHGATYEMFSKENPYREMKTNKILADCFKNNLEKMGIKTDFPARNNFGSLDMGDVSHKIPSIHPMIGVCDDNIGGHTPEFREVIMNESSDKILISTAKAMALTLAELFTNYALIVKARKEHETK